MVSREEWREIGLELSFAAKRLCVVWWPHWWQIYFSCWILGFIVQLHSSSFPSSSSSSLIQSWKRSCRSAWSACPPPTVVAAARTTWAKQLGLEGSTRVRKSWCESESLETIFLNNRKAEKSNRLEHVWGGGSLVLRWKHKALHMYYIHIYVYIHMYYLCVIYINCKFWQYFLLTPKM